MRPLSLIRTVALLILPAALRAQSPSPATMDSLLSRLEGRWTMTGTVRGKAVTYRLDTQRTLRNRYVELHMEDASQPSTYEARVLIGVDSAKSVVIAHWIDSFGAGYSIPHATGVTRGDTLELRFPYATGVFKDMFTYDRRSDSWHILIEAEDGPGKWKPFADYRVRRR